MIDEDTIGQTEAYRAFNVLIDEKVRHLVSMLTAIQNRCGQLATEKPRYVDTVTARVSYDTQGRREQSLPLNLHDLKQVRDMIDEALKIEQSIGDLQRFKLRLANDYDFTRGDDTTQKAVFG